MEDILDVYHRPYDARYPQVCMDEGSKQLLADKREGEPMEPGKPARCDNEYERHGTINVFVAYEPLGGKCVVKVSKRRQRPDGLKRTTSHYKDGSGNSMRPCGISLNGSPSTLLERNAEKRP